MAPSLDRRRNAPRPALVMALVTLSAAACGHAGNYVAAEKLPPISTADPPYRIAGGDVLSVRVWQQDALSMDRVRVRDDGRITMPLLQDVEVGGLTTSELAANLMTQLKAYVVNPVVTVAMTEMRPLRVSVLGNVARPGSYDLDHGAGVLHAIASAGGLTEYAHRDRIFVLRHDNPPARIRFRYDALIRGESSVSSFRLRSSDILVIE